MTTINRDEWLKALTDAGLTFEDDFGALTMQEVMEMLQVNRSTATHRMDRLIATKRAVKTWKRALRLDGRMQHMRAYKLLKRHE